MLTVESQVLERHLPLLANQSLLFAGAINDDFPAQIQNQGNAVTVWSWYFDYAKRAKTAVNFGEEIENSADLIIYYWTKNKQEVQFQLFQLLSHAPLGQKMLIVGENRCGVRSVENLLAPYGNIAKIDSARRCGLYHFELTKSVPFQFADFWKTYQHDALGNLVIHSLPGVFSANELDAGTALLLSTFQQKIQGKVLDLGCGAGIVGAYLKQHNPLIELTMSDIHALALASTRETLARNQLSAILVASDVFSDIDGKFDLIVSNPPFHDGIDTAYRAVNALISQAKNHLLPRGELRIVANRFLSYPDLLDRYFGSHQVLAKSNKFKVYRAFA